MFKMMLRLFKRSGSATMFVIAAVLTAATLTVPTAAMAGTPKTHTDNQSVLTSPVRTVQNTSAVDGAEKQLDVALSAASRRTHHAVRSAEIPPDVCHLRIAPGTNSDRISRLYFPPGKPKHGEHKQYIMVGRLVVQTWCSTHHAVKGARHTSVEHIGYPRHSIGVAKVLRGITSKPRANKEGQLIITTRYVWPLSCSSSAGTTHYRVQIAGELTGYEPSWYHYDNDNVLWSRTHGYHFKCGTKFHTIAPKDKARKQSQVMSGQMATKAKMGKAA